MKNTIKLLAVLLALFMTASLFAVPVLAEETAAEAAAEEAPESEENAEEAEEEEEEEWIVPEPKPVLLAVSFGTSFNENRAVTIDALNAAFAEAFPEYEVRVAFTSQIIIDKLHARDNNRIDNVKQAMHRLIADGIKEVLVVPTHVMAGFEYNDVLDDIKPFIPEFESVKVSRPILDSEEDFDRVVKILTDESADYNEEGNAIVFMGHGTEHEANAVYAKFQEKLLAAGFDRYIVGTVESTPSIDDVIQMVKNGNYKKVYLLPLMIVAGDHANNDMAGDEEDSWKSLLMKEGYEVEAILNGMGGYKGIQELLIDHIKAAKEVKAEEESAQEAGESKQGKLADGTYEISVESSSSMFNIVHAELTVADGKMSCAMTMGGTGYLHLFMGTGEEAAQASEDDYIKFEETAEGAHVFTVPVEALDQDINCAAFSKKKEEWYDRVLVFKSEMIPAEAFIKD